MFFFGGDKWILTSKIIKLTQPPLYAKKSTGSAPSSPSLCPPAGKAYPPEFYYDTYNPLWQNRPRVFDFKLQWTQMNPNAVDRIVAYRLGFRQVWMRPGSERVTAHVTKQQHLTCSFCVQRPQQCFVLVLLSRQKNVSSTSQMFLYFQGSKQQAVIFSQVTSSHTRKEKMPIHPLR